jgi:hypothetical protein
MPTAKITLNITRFAAGGCCEISRPVIQPGGGGNRVRYKNPGDPNDYTLVIKGKGAAPLDIEFTIPDYTPGPGATPLTVTGANGGANFQNQKVSGSTVTITDVFADVGAGASWNYSISVLNSSNVQGMIDPPIENEQMS